MESSRISHKKKVASVRFFFNLSQRSIVLHKYSVLKVMERDVMYAE